MKKLLLSTFFVLNLLPVFAQVGIGTTTPDQSSILDLSASNKGFLAPRINLTSTTNASIDGINANANGLMIYNTNASLTGGNGVGYYFWDGSTWTAMKAASTAGTNWSLTGNTVTATDFLGSTNSQPLIFKVNSTESGKIDPSGSLSLGLSSSATVANATAIGSNAKALTSNATAIGFSATAQSLNAIAIGNGAKAKDFDNTIAIGTNASASGGINGIAIGNGAITNVVSGIAIGTGAYAKDYDNTIAIGRSSRASKDFTIAIGDGAQTNATGSIVIGSNAAKVGNYGVSIGTAAGSSSSGDRAISIGAGTSTGLRAVAIGNSALATGTESVSLGNNAKGSADNATAIGANAIANQANTVILGSNANVGIGTSAPKDKLHVNDGKLRITDGTQGAGKVLTSDANGSATWQAPANQYTEAYGEMFGNNDGGVNVTGDYTRSLNASSVLKNVLHSTTEYYLQTTIAGNYEISYAISMLANDATARTFDFYVEKAPNNNTYTKINQSSNQTMHLANGQRVTTSKTFLVYLDANDRVRLRYTVGAGSTSFPANTCNLSIRRIGDN
ncbi:hypothetical protein [Leeuwenhoekiella sp. MAR_2009_132]|uniref:hypothetical protein n=1 Tax=Leeuwenhoekiella sp. MAR_2009_132 TaxID=1392489 RepID=UPI0004900BBA|nr:hypothetical protein [Leeuwenhoekiella sp. MAR_2009_132]